MVRVWRPEASHSTGGNVIWGSHSGKQSGSPLKSQMQIYCMTPRCLSKRNAKLWSFIAALSMLAPNWKPPGAHQQVDRQTTCGISTHWNTLQE